MAQERRPVRIFKTGWFAKAAGKASIADAELCMAAAAVKKGQGDDLGGGVFKKRLNENRHRFIILAQGRLCWIYAYLFAKKDRSNISDEELRAFRDLAALYAAKSDRELQRELQVNELVEICREQTRWLQERSVRGNS